MNEEDQRVRASCPDFRSYVEVLRSLNSHRPSTGFKGVHRRGPDGRLEARNSPFPVRHVIFSCIFPCIFPRISPCIFSHLLSCLPIPDCAIHVAERPRTYEMLGLCAFPFLYLLAM
jgi:hypothetical protein